MMSHPFAPKSPIMGDFLSKFSLPDRPEGSVPEIPMHLDSMSDNDLMATYSEFIAWIAYAKADLVIAEINEERAANNQKICEATTLIQQWGEGAKGDTVTLAKARRDTEPEVISAQEDYMEARAYRKLVESVFERCERGAQVISRELSRRISLAPQERRQARYSA